jgi:RHS repeat-associated protein
MFRHDDVPDDYEPVTVAGLLQHGEEAITAARRAQKRQSPVTRTGDKVQVMSAVGAMQAAGHDKTHRTGSIVPGLAKNARTGHPRFRNGKKTVPGRPGQPARDVSSGAVHYYFSDHLGTHAVVENATGTACEQDIDYYPYGGVEEDYCSTPVAQHYKFIGKERDTETGLDDFVARYDTSNLGRFMTPDWAEKPTAVPYAHFGNPQSLNLYSYVENNPTTFGDPDGHGACSATSDWLSCAAPKVAEGKR